jgi:hypothetical protein
VKLYVQQHGDTIDFGELPGGDAGIRATLASMSAAAMEAAGEERVQHVARLLDAEPVWHRGPSNFLQRLYDFLRTRRRYEADPKGIELIRDPLVTLAEMQAGSMPGIDCDDLAVLAGALLLAQGRYVPVFVVAGRTPKADGGKFHHVFYGVLLHSGGPVTQTNVLPFDPQEGIPAGEWPVRAQRVGVSKVRLP